MSSHLDTKALRAVIEQPEKASLWGEPRTITPRLVDRVFGYGRKLVLVVPLNTRPNYYVIRGDSSWQCGKMFWSESQHGYEEEGTVDVFEWAEPDSWDGPWGMGVLNTIEEEYGSVDDEAYRDEEESPDFPVADFSVGWSWGWMKWPPGFEPIPLALIPKRF